MTLKTDYRPLFRRFELFFFRSRLSWLFAKLMSGKARHLYQPILSDVGPLPAGSHIADIGCGHATFLCMYLSEYHEVIGFGLDQSAELLRFAQSQCKTAGVTATFQTGDVHSAQIPASTFDVIVSISSIYCWHDPVLVLNKLYDALIPGGRLYIYDELPVRSFKEIIVALFVQRIYGLGVPAYTRSELEHFIKQSHFRKAVVKVDRLIISLEMAKNT